MPAVPRSEAPAKINWTLEVLGRRPDGFHEIASVMATLGLKDTVELEPADAWRIDVEAGEALQADLAAHGNIMERAIAEAAAAWKRANGEPDAVAVWPPEGLPAARLHLTKRIPAAAGLGGGSSDAAATLRLVFDYWAIATGNRPDVSLGDVAARIGSDVPFFLTPSGAAYVTGRGEQVQPLRPVATTWVVLLVPPISVARKTARLYSLLRPEHYTSGQDALDLIIPNDPPLLRTVWDEYIVNVFDNDGVADIAFPGIERYQQALEDALGPDSGLPAHLCGAGPTIFILAVDAEDAQQIAASLRADGYETYAVSSPA